MQFCVRSSGGYHIATRGNSKEVNSGVKSRIEAVKPVFSPHSIGTNHEGVRELSIHAKVTS